MSFLIESDVQYKNYTLFDILKFNNKFDHIFYNCLSIINLINPNKSTYYPDIDYNLNSIMNTIRENLYNIKLFNDNEKSMYQQLYKICNVNALIHYDNEELVISIENYNKLYELNIYE